MIFTTNKPLSEWGKVLHDEDMAAAILDRVLERGRFIHLDGPSGRTRHLNPEDTLLPNAERLRISGISGSEFPEPTNRMAEGAWKAYKDARMCPEGRWKRASAVRALKWVFGFRLIRLKMKYLFTRPENQQRRLRSRLSRLKALRRHLKRKI
jgi:IstB-like ATP binding protein